MKNLICREEFDVKIGEIYRAIDSKVSWKHFTWIVSTILGIYVVISLAIWTDLRDMKVEMRQSSISIAEIQTILNQAEITK